MCQHFKDTNMPFQTSTCSIWLRRKETGQSCPQGYWTWNNQWKILWIKFTPILKRVNLNYLQYISSIRYTMFAWTRLGPSKLEKVHVVKTYILSKFDHVVAILPNPSAEIRDTIETAIARFINQGHFQTIKELIFTPTQYGGLGVPKLFDFWNSLRISWLKRIYSNSFWLKLLTESIPGHKNQIMHYSQSEYEKAFIYGKNPFWKGVLKS